MKIAIAIIHGMGSQKKDETLPMQQALKKLYQLKGKDPENLVFQEVYWADVLMHQQEKLYRRMSKSADLNFVKLRNFFITYLGDVVAYQPLSHKKTIDPDEIDVYSIIHTRVSEALNKLSHEAGKDSPLVIIAHSLGSVIASNFIWDIQHMQPNQLLGLSRLEQLKTHIGFITAGSPLALWALRYKSLGKPIAFPSNEYTDSYYLKARWLNFFDADDIIASPLKSINDQYKSVVSKDIEIQVGNILTSWNPASHSEYFTDKDFLRPVANFLITIS